MQNLSERLEKTIKYYNDTHGVPSSYHFKMIKNLIDNEYLFQEKEQIIEAYSKGSEDIYSYKTGGQKYYDSKFGDNPEAGI